MTNKKILPKKIKPKSFTIKNGKKILKKGWQDITNGNNGTIENIFYPLFSKGG